MGRALLYLLAAVIAASCRRDAVPTSSLNEAKSERASAVPPTRPKPDDIVEFVADPIPTSAYRYLKDFKVTRPDLEAILRDYYAMEREVWRHTYQHIADNDVTGHVVLKDGSTVEWMARPGGLATLKFPNGETMYLARDR